MRVPTKSHGVIARLPKAAEAISQKISLWDCFVGPSGLLAMTYERDPNYSPFY